MTDLKLAECPICGANDPIFIRTPLGLVCRDHR